MLELNGIVKLTLICCCMNNVKIEQQKKNNINEKKLRNIGSSINLVIVNLHEFNILFIIYPQKELLIVKKDHFSL